MLRRIKNKLNRKWAYIKSPKMHSINKLDNNSFLNLFSIADLQPKNRNDLITFYERKIKANWLESPTSITDLRINLDQLDDNELIEKANSILNYDLSPSGIKPKVENDCICWMHNCSKGKEWLLMINRHAWWAVLGKAYLATKDEKYARCFVSQMLDWVSTNPPPKVKTESSPTWRLMEVGMRLRISWIPAFSMFFDSPVFTNDAKETMLRSIFDHASFLHLFQTNRNHLLRESNGLAAAALYFSEFTQSKKWLDVALARIEGELRSQVNKDGSQIEVSTGYQWLVIDEFEALYRILAANNTDLPNENLKDWLSKMYGMLSRLVRPNGTLPEINDGFILWPNARIADGGKLLSRDDLIYISTQGKEGIEPADTSCYFENAGLAVIRSDWSDRGHYLLFDAAPYGGPHGHEDKLSIEVSAFGEAFIVDPGSYTYDSGNQFRNYFVSSASHNTIMVDGKSQVRRWQNDNMDPKVGEQPRLEWRQDDNYNYVAATYSDGYGDFGIIQKENTIDIRDVEHRRAVWFIQSDYWIILDTLESSSSHTYQTLFHAAPDVKVEQRDGSVSVFNSANGRAALCLIPIIAPTERLTSQVVGGAEKPIQGWFSVDHNKKVPIDTLIYETESKQNLCQPILMFPTEDNNYPRVEYLAESTEAKIQIIIHHANGRDHLSICPASEGRRDSLSVQRLDRTGQIIAQFDA